MKIYILDDSEIQEVNGEKCKIYFSICHYESTDFEDSEPIAAEQQIWSENRVMAELTAGEAITGIPGVELRRDRHYPDGRIERIETLSIDVTALFELHLHLKLVDAENPDDLMW